MALSATLVGARHRRRGLGRSAKVTALRVQEAIHPNDRERKVASLSRPMAEARWIQIATRAPEGDDVAARVLVQVLVDLPLDRDWLLLERDTIEKTSMCAGLADPDGEVDPIRPRGHVDPKTHSPIRLVRRRLRVEREVV